MFTNCKAMLSTIPIVFFLLFCARLTHAQSTSGMLEGSVQDSSGGLLPGAIVRVQTEGTQHALQTVTDAEGKFRFVSLPFGKYQVEATLTGFAKNVVQSVTVEPVNPAKLSITLAPAGLTETVNISADGLLLQTENSTQSATLSAKELTSLPTASRNVTHLIVAEPGVSAPLPDRTGAGLNIATTPGTQDQDSVQSLNPSVNGAPDEQFITLKWRRQHESAKSWWRVGKQLARPVGCARSGVSAKRIV